MIVTAFRAWQLRHWVTAAAATALAAAVIGIPTGIIQTPYYTRMTPVLWWNWPVWAASSLLLGLTAATYLRAAPQSPRGTTRNAGATLLSTFAVGCPVCNKLIVSLVGVSGALDYWAPVQPLLGLAGVALLLAGLRIRLRGQISCATPQVFGVPAG